MNYTELKKRIITGSLIGTTLSSIFFFLPPTFTTILLLSCLIEILIFEMPRLLNYQKISSWIFTIFYPIFPFYLLITLNQSNQRMLLLFIFVVTFAHDIGAYFAGNFFGKHKLLPSVSPKKTWEGFVGGIIAVFIMVVVFYKASFVALILGSLAIACAATIGDLFESWLKRKASIKDTGTLLPGHGGLLDRFDSILFVAIIIYFLHYYYFDFASPVFFSPKIP